jgi:3-deoxy-D-manno-octulosonate 8-phosphate phosphatase (KDO 8-P phosphatase)
MGVERLRVLVGVETGIITGERSLPLHQRAAKLHIQELHLGIRDKLVVLYEILEQRNLNLHQVAYIGDDTNDVEVMRRVGLSACPADGMRSAKVVADYVCQNGGGHGAFREFAELIIAAKNGNGA